MFNYSKIVEDHFLHPRRLGLLSESGIDPARERLIVSEAGHVIRGDALRLSLRIAKENEKILDAGFQNYGTGMPIASASFLCNKIVGMTLTEALKVSAEDLDREMEGLPELKSRQPVLVLDALERAGRSFRGQPQREQPRPGEPPLCTCFQVPESVIERAVRLRGLKTVDEITAVTSAGGGCHTCHPELEDILARCARHEYKVHIPPDEYYAAHKLYGIPPPSDDELKHNPPAAPARADRVAPDGFVYPDRSPVAAVVAENKPRARPHKAWKDLSHAERIEWIEDVIEHDLRPAIRTDGGDVKLVELADNRVRVTLHGHCQNCHSALSTLKLGIEKRLQEAVWPELEVEEVFNGQ
jgi:NifU-like protein